MTGHAAAAIGDREMRRFQTLIYDRAGIYLSDSKRALLVARLSKRLRTLQMQRYSDYLDLVESSPDELVEMLDRISTNETRFFREQKQFDFLEQVLIPSWRQQAAHAVRPKRLRVWSAGCSTGEEPYSVAMTLLTHLEGWQIEIVATDLSTRVLQTAVNAIWPIERAASIPSALLKRFMLRGHGSQQGKMKAGEELRTAVSFFRLNLRESDWQLDGSFDLILCRNVLIYFDAASRRDVVERLASRLQPDGYLFIGHAETLHGVSSRLQSAAPTIYRRQE